MLPLASQLAWCQTPGTGGSPDGSAVYAQHCATCHGPEGEGVNAIISIAGPSLQAVHDRQHVLEMVRNGKDVMPTFGNVLSAQQIEAVADYVTQHIAVISVSGGDLTQGGVLFRENCAACHRTAVRGGVLAFTGMNAPALTGKSPSTIAGAVRSGPGPMPAFPPSIINDQQLASIVAYVDFMQKPPSPGGIPMNFYGPVAEGFMAWMAIILLLITTGWIEKRGKG